MRKERRRDGGTEGGREGKTKRKREGVGVGERETENTPAHTGTINQLPPTGYSWSNVQRKLFRPALHVSWAEYSPG